MSFVYLASPYSHINESVREARATAAAIGVGHVMEFYNTTTYSPIVHFHHVYKHAIYDPCDINFWIKHNKNMLRHASKLYVLDLPGWKESAGVALEIEFALHLGLVVEHVWPGDKPESLFDVLNAYKILGA